jgi:uncharacterized membrane protein YcjF (UPF0283 family)
MKQRNNIFDRIGELAPESNDDEKSSGKNVRTHDSSMADARESAFTETPTPATQAPAICESDDSTLSRMRLRKRSVDQRFALFRTLDAKGEPLAEGDVLFGDENDELKDDRLLDTSADSLNPNTLADRVRQVNWAAISFLTIIVAAFLLLALSQTAVLAREVAYLPVPGNWFGFASLFVIWIAMGVATWRLTSGLIKLKRTPGVSLSALKTLQSRATARRTQRESERAAERSIREFLQSYPNDRRQQKLLVNAGFGEATVKTSDFFQTIEDLLRNDHGVPDQWLADVRTRIIEPLDDAALIIVHRISLQVGASTAISPRGSLDSLIVLTQSYRLVSELCALYGVRPGGLETCYILGQSFLSVILAAGGDQAADTVETQLREKLQDSLGTVAGAVVAKLGSRLGEGTVNALFVRRIGLRLKVYLCPIAK